MNPQKTIDEKAIEYANVKAGIVSRGKEINVPDVHLGNPRKYEAKITENVEAKIAYSCGATETRDAIVEWLRSEEAEKCLPRKPMQFKFEVSWASARDWADEIEKRFK